MPSNYAVGTCWLQVKEHHRSQISAKQGGCTLASKSPARCTCFNYLWATYEHQSIIQVWQRCLLRLSALCTCRAIMCTHNGGASLLVFPRRSDYCNVCLLASLLAIVYRPHAHRTASLPAGSLRMLLAKYLVCALMAAPACAAPVAATLHLAESAIVLRPTQDADVRAHCCA